MDTLNRPAARPRNSRLNAYFPEAIGLAPLPFWQDSFDSFVAFRSSLGSRGEILESLLRLARGSLCYYSISLEWSGN